MIEHVQINDVAPVVHYVGDGVQAAFIFPFAVFKADGLEVWIDNARVAGGYTVSGAGISAGGSVLFVVPPVQGAIITLRRRIALARVTDFQSDGIIRAKTLNDELDYQVAAVQQVAEELGRCVRRRFTSASTADLTLPDPVGNRVLKWNAAGDALVNSDSDPDALVTAAQVAAGTATAQAVLAADKAAAAAASAADIAAMASLAGASAEAAAASAASVALPNASEHGGHYLRQRVDATGLEYRTPVQMADDIGIGEAFQDLGSGTSLVLDGNGKAALKLVMTGTTAISAANLAAGKVYSFLLWLAQDANGARAFVLPGNTRWPYGEVPSWPIAPGKFSLFCLSTWDAGATWQGAFVGAEYA